MRSLGHRVLHCFIDLQCKSIGGLRLGGGHVGHVQMHSMGASAILIILFICLSGQSNLLSVRVFVLQTTIDERIWPGIVNGLCYWWNTSIRPWCRNEAPMHRRQQSLSPNQYHRQSFALSNPFTSLCCLSTGHLPDKQCSQLDSFFFIFWLQCAVILLAESLPNTGWLSVATDSSSANQSFAHHLSVCLVEFQRQRTPS